MKCNLIAVFCLVFSYNHLQACSIVGYIGQNQCKQFILDGLSRLEYRGYDSAGLACIDQATNDLFFAKAEGKLQNLKNKAFAVNNDGFVGIGHTRWATHGEPTEANAHPHHDCTHKVAVVHNGIIENHFDLRELLCARGHQFYSSTDTEVIAHLIEEFAPMRSSLQHLLVDVCNTLKGAYAFIGIDQRSPNTIFAVRKSSPICIGIGIDEMFIASDFLAFAGKTDKVLFLPDESFAIIEKDSIKLFDFAGNSLPLEIQTVNSCAQAYDKEHHEHFMLKEIHEQRSVIKASVEYCESLHDSIWDHLGITADFAKNIKRISIVGCGTSWHAGRIAQFFFETVCKIPVTIYLASEFRYMPFFPEEDALYIAISQSGETADTLEAIRLIQSYKLPVVSITNVFSSTMARETDGFLLTKAGPEIAVASTKAFTTQQTVLYWLAYRLAFEKGIVTIDALQQAADDLKHAAEVLDDALMQYQNDIVQTYAKKYCIAERFMFLGRHVGYPFAMEAALKLKEISYIFAQGYPAGELKHGSIALVDIKTPVVLFSHLDPIIYQKLLSNAQEVKARKGHLIAFVFEGQDELIALADQVFVIKRVAPLLEPLAMSALMQFFAYQIAKELGCDIDQPRNLAKAVTVE